MADKVTLRDVVQTVKAAEAAGLSKSDIDRAMQQAAEAALRARQHNR